MATSITCMRHGEKPDKDGDETGVDARGAPDPRGLTPRGWQRAGALVRWIAPDPVVDPDAIRPVPVPPAIFAAAPYAGSERALLTMQPLAHLLDITIDIRFAGEDVEGLVKAAKLVEGDVLVSWRHEHLPEIARLLCPNLEPAPKWKDKCFDQAWLFTPHEGEWKLRRIAQRLLPGDAESYEP
jgi:hypothetical protein